MLNIDEIQNGIVIDHILAGTSMRLYELMGLNSLDCSVAILKNVRSAKMGKKDMIKLEGDITGLKLDVLGYLDPHITIAEIQNGRIVRKYKPAPPKRLVNITRCTNPRCISSIEEECEQIFEMSENGRYRCIYCEQELWGDPR